MRVTPRRFLPDRSPIGTGALAATMSMLLLLPACDGGGDSTSGPGGGGGTGGQGTSSTAGGGSGGGGSSGASTTTATPTQRFTVDGDTVVDESTGLVWQRDLGQLKHAHANGQAYCAELPLDGGGFRMPTLPELEGLVITGSMPTIDGYAFPGTPMASFWSSTLLDGSDFYAWTVSFYDGTSEWLDGDEPHHVRCVR